MSEEVSKTLKDALDDQSLGKLLALKNDRLCGFVADAVALCRPERVFVADDSPADQDRIRQMALAGGEETALATEGHTIHFDGSRDQGRDPANTKYLLEAGVSLGERLNSTDREAGLAEVRGLLDGIMGGRTMIVRFLCLGPAGSVFALGCVQLTDSAYVAHSESLLYRAGYEQFRRIRDGAGFFRFLHGQGRLAANNTSADVDKRRVYIDIAEDAVYSVNTQYGGNTIGLKKLALRLAIRKADREGWLAEHMFVMGVGGPGGRKTYFTGAFPSGCGKTSTAMLPGESIVGDDIAYLRVIGGTARAVNVERGIFGIIRDVNPDNDPVIHRVLTGPGEVIFSNVLVADGRPYWVGMGEELPAAGVNHCGKWQAGKCDEDGNEIPPSHWNARYTVSIDRLENVDERLNDPEGVPIGGVLYGGRDSDTSVPVQQSFDWAHGIITMGASLESETTAAIVGGAAGRRRFDLMSIIDFLAIPLGKYVRNNLDFGARLASPPAIFAVNYFLRDSEGSYLNGMLDKAVWIKWAELRCHGDVRAVRTPTGLIPTCDDLVRLFREVLDRPYTPDDYAEQFKLRIPENLAKLERVEEVYRDVPDTPEVVFEALAAQRARLETLRADKGDCASPLELA